MSKPSHRGAAKARKRKKTLAAQAFQREKRAMYPRFTFRMKNVPPEIQEIIKRVAFSINLGDATVFEPARVRFYKAMKHHGYGPAFEACFNLRPGDEPQKDLALYGYVGNVLFERLCDASPEFAEPVPLHDVCVVPDGRDFLVKCESLNTSHTPHGRIYFSHRKPSLEIQGSRYTVAFTRHAAEQIRTRVVLNSLKYNEHTEAFSFLGQCVYFEPCQIHGNPAPQEAFTLYNLCMEHFFSWDYLDAVSPDRPQGRKHYYRVGYCPVALHDEFAVAKSMLPPGYNNTPEIDALLKSDIPVARKERMKASLQDMSLQRLYETRDFEVLRWFHENGVPQIVTLNCKVLDYS